MPPRLAAWIFPLVVLSPNYTKTSRKRASFLPWFQVPAQHHVALERMGLVDLIGAGRIFDSRHACMAAYKSECK